MATTRTQAIFYGNSKAKKPLTLHHPVSRGRKVSTSVQNRSEGLETSNANRRYSPDLASSPSRPVYEAGFDGYQQGMHLIDADPTRMHSESSDDSGGIYGQDLHEISSPHDEVIHPDSHVLSLGSTPSTVGVSKFYSSRQPQQSRHQSGYHKSTDEHIITLLQSQQASLEKVHACKYPSIMLKFIHPYMHHHVPDRELVLC